MPEQILGGEQTTEQTTDVTEEKTLVTEETADEKSEDKTLLAGDEGDKKETPKDGEPDDGSKGAPEKYEDFSVPEGIELDTDALAKASETFKELNLDQEQAQQLVDIQTELAKREAEASMDAWKQMTDKWAETAKDDKEFGGGEFDANLAVAKKAIEAFATDEFKEMLNFTGVGNNPEMIRFFFRVGKEISEDGVFLGGKQNSEKTQAQRMYPTMDK